MVYLLETVVHLEKFIDLSTKLDFSYKHIIMITKLCVRRNEHSTSWPKRREKVNYIVRRTSQKFYWRKQSVEELWYCVSSRLPTTIKLGIMQLQKLNRTKDPTQVLPERKRSDDLQKNNNKTKQVFRRSLFLFCIYRVDEYHQGISIL